jgi:hypothetical protein
MPDVGKSLARKIAAREKRFGLSKFDKPPRPVADTLPVCERCGEPLPDSVCYPCQDADTLSYSDSHREY